MKSKKPECILNVDDSPGQRYAVARLFRGAGYEVKEARTGSEALKLVQERPDLVILDINLPDMTGYEVCEKIRSNPALSSIPVLHLSASVISSEGAVKGLEGGADAYLTHPVDRGVLLATARALIRMRHAEREASKNELRLRTLTESIPQIVWAIAPDGKLEYANHRFWKYTGLSPQQDFYGVARATVHPEHFSLLLKVWNEAFKTGLPHECEYLMRRADGTYRWHLARALPLLDENKQILQWYATATDINDQKRAEESARFMAEAGRALASSLDSDSLLNTVTKLAVRQLADYCVVHILDEVDRKSLRPLAAEYAAEVKDMDLRRLKERVQRALTQSNFRSQLDPILDVLILDSIQRGEARFISSSSGDYGRNGPSDPEQIKLLRELGLQILIVPLKGHQRIVGAVTFMRDDLSEKKYTQQEINEGMSLVSQAALSFENARLYLDAKRAIRTRDDLLAMVSHDLRNPIGAIDLNASLIGKNVLVLRNPSIQQSLEKPVKMIQKTTHAMNRLIGELLDVAKIDEGRLSLDVSPVSAHMLVKEAVATFQPMAAQKMVQLRYQLKGKDCRVGVDKERLQRVFSNLIGNAIKFTPQGGEVTVQVLQGPSSAWIAISDTGPGIRPDDLPHLFDRFWQASKTHRLGTGLGLAIAKGIVEAHGGKIWVESKVGSGSTFFFSIPFSNSHRVRLQRVV